MNTRKRAIEPRFRPVVKPTTSYRFGKCKAIFVAKRLLGVADHKTAALVINHYIQLIAEQLLTGNPVWINRFGTFGFQFRNGRVTRTKRWGKEVEIVHRPGVYIRFRPSATLRRAIIRAWESGTPFPGAPAPQPKSNQP